MATPSVSTSTVTQSTDRFTGRVKWFNNKAGYGFITVTDGPKSGTDIFVHHSSINVSTQQYKYLVQGEYIEFTLSNVSSSDHEYQAVDVSGIKGGKLMCETRHELTATRTSYKAQDKAQTKPEVQTPVEKASDDTKPWTPARKPRQQAAPAQAPAQDQAPAKVTRGPGGRGAGRGQSTAGRGTTGGRGGRGRGKSTA
jgi:CspA family cold shock protein